VLCDNDWQCFGQRGLAPSLCWTPLLGGIANKIVGLSYDVLIAFLFDEFTEREQLKVIKAVGKHVQNVIGPETRPFEQIPPDLLRLCSQVLEHRFERQDLDQTLEPVLLQKLTLRRHAQGMRILTLFINSFPF
jgi:hypothetical protein